MREQFIPYKLALILKELGFEEGFMFAFYDEKGTLNADKLYSLNHCSTSGNQAFKNFTENTEYTILKSQYCSAPLWQQAFAWFREKHNLYVEINLDSYKEPYLLKVVIKKLDVTKTFVDKGWYPTGIKGVDTFNNNEHNLAKEAAITKLISIIKKS